MSADAKASTLSRAAAIAARLLAPPAILLLCLWLWTVQPVGPAAGTSVPAEVGTAGLRRDVEYLAGTLARRNHAHPETLARAAGYIERRLRAAGGDVEVDAYEVEGAIYRNVVARFGPAGGRPVVIGAHYDADERTPGADDNASGVAGLLALADHFGRVPPRLPVEIVAYCLEEAPFFGTEDMGSRRHARALRAAGREPRLVMVLEMIGYFSEAPGSQRYPLASLGWAYPDKGDFIAVVGNYASFREVRTVKAAMRAAATVPVEAIAAPEWLPGVGLSDHASYWREGMPAVMVTDTAFFRNPNYHQAGDVPATLDYVRMAGVVHALARVVRQVEEAMPS